MASSNVPNVEPYTEVVQVIRGGEPDDDGTDLPMGATLIGSRRVSYRVT